MVGTVMVDRITAHITQLVNIPGHIVALRGQAVLDVAALDFLIAAVTSIPKAKIDNHQNRLVQLNIEIHAFIVQIFAIPFIHLFLTFLFGKFRIFCLQILTPILVIQRIVTPNQVLRLCHRASPRFFGRLRVFRAVFSIVSSGSTVLWQRSICSANWQI